MVLPSKVIIGWNVWPWLLSIVLGVCGTPFTTTLPDWYEYVVPAIVNTLPDVNGWPETKNIDSEFAVRAWEPNGITTICGAVDEVCIWWRAIVKDPIIRAVPEVASETLTSLQVMAGPPGESFCEPTRIPEDDSNGIPLNVISGGWELVGVTAVYEPDSVVMLVEVDEVMVFETLCLVPIGTLVVKLNPGVAGSRVDVETGVMVSTAIEINEVDIKLWTGARANGSPPPLPPDPSQVGLIEIPADDQISDGRVWFSQSDAVGVHIIEFTLGMLDVL
jgi:hypothetical protein